MIAADAPRRRAAAGFGQSPAEQRRVVGAFGHRPALFVLLIISDKVFWFWCFLQIFTRAGALFAVAKSCGEIRVLIKFT